MKYSIPIIKDTYYNVVFIGLHLINDNEPFNIFVVDDNDKVIAIYESVWSEDFKTTEYEFVRTYDYIGRKMAEVAEEVMDNDCCFRPL